MNIKYKRFQQFWPKNFFEFVHIFSSVFGPLMWRHKRTWMIVIFSHLTSLVRALLLVCCCFLLGNNLNEIVIDAGLDLVLETYPQHTPLLKWQSLVCVCVCVSRMVINDCFCGQHLSHYRMHEIRDEIFVDLLVLLVY